jgi:hypothetical protein
MPSSFCMMLLWTFTTLIASRHAPPMVWLPLIHTLVWTYRASTEIRNMPEEPTPA